MNINNQAKDQNDEIRDSDYYFSLQDFLSAFYKRRFVFISVFVAVISLFFIYILITPSVYIVGHEVKITNNDFWKKYDYSVEYPGSLKIHQSKQINEALVINKIKELLDNANQSKIVAEKISFEMVDDRIGKIFVTTDDPQLEGDNLHSFLESLQEKVWSELKDQQIMLTEELISGLIEQNTSRRFESEINRKSKIASLKEAHEIASKLDIKEPILSFHYEPSPVYMLGTKYLLAEISILKNRENDELFFNSFGRNAAEIKSELKYFQALDDEKLTPSEKNEKEGKILQLELEIAHYLKRSKDIRLARIAMLEESLSIAKALGINEPLNDKIHIPQVSYSNNNGFGIDLSDNDDIVSFPSDEIQFDKPALMGTKYLSALISSLADRESEDNFNQHILSANLQIDYLENYLKIFKEYDPKPFEILNKFKKKFDIKKQNQFIRGLTIGILFGLLSALIAILLKNDLRRKDD